MKFVRIILISLFFMFMVIPGFNRHLVKSTYYDFDIFNVTEIIKGDKIVYLVKMEGKSCWKTIRLADGELEITEEYLKS